MDVFSSLARDHLLELGGTLLGVAFTAAVQPLSEIVNVLTRSLLSRLTPTRENDTIIAIEKWLREEDEELERRQQQDDDTEHLQQLQAASKAIEEREITLAREAEDRRVAKEIQQEEERRIAREIEERNIIEAARMQEEQKVIKEAEERRVARETDERNIAEAARKEKQQRLVEEAEERMVAEEARQAERRKIAEATRQAEMRVHFDEEVRRMKDWWSAEAARQADEQKQQTEGQRLAQEAENRKLIQTERKLSPKAAMKSNKKIALKKKREMLAIDAREENRRKLVNEAEARRIAAEALEVEEAEKLKNQRIVLAEEMRIVAERLRQAEMVADERSGIQQNITEEPHPAEGISKDELARAKAKLQWCPGQFRFALSGGSGSGKSSLINIFLDLPDNDKNGASTDVVETTLTVGRYPDPGDQPPRKWTVWYDLPGWGTQTIDDVDYFKRQSMYLFDLVLVMLDNRITKTDLGIIRDCGLQKIPSFIIRSKADMHIKNHMKSNGYESDDDDPEDTKILRQKSREHFIAKTRANVESELKKAGLPPQRVYIVSCSPAFRREYSEFISGSVMSANGRGRSRFVDEMELIHDLMLAAAARRCDIEPQLTAPAAQTVVTDTTRFVSRLRAGHADFEPQAANHTTRTETADRTLLSIRPGTEIQTRMATPPSQTVIIDRAALISRLRTGQTKSLGVRIRCPCDVKKKNVEHIMVECFLTKGARSQAKRALGVRKLTLVVLLYQERGNPWAEQIWETFMEARKTMREDIDDLE